MALINDHKVDALNKRDIFQRIQLISSDSTGYIKMLGEGAEKSRDSGNLAMPVLEFTQIYIYLLIEWQMSSTNDRPLLDKTNFYLTQNIGDVIADESFEERFSKTKISSCRLQEIQISNYYA